MEAKATQQLQEASISAVVIRADGTREDLGVISYWNKDPKKRLRYRLQKMCGKVVKG